jgi:Mrp family chromosome partitioning ATPase/capsular polysaccharide biosynthesis protein
LQPTESPLRQYLQILKRQAWIVALVPLVTLAATFALLELRDPVYRASTTLVVGTRARTDLPPQLGTSGVTRTMNNLLASDLIARSVIRRHRLNMSVEDFLKKLKVEVLPDTSVIQVKYESTQPRLALSVIAEINRIFTQQLADTLGTESPGVRGRPGSFRIVVRTFDPPHLEPEPIAANPVTSLLFAGMAGIVLGILLAVAREALDSRIRGRRDAEAWFGAPVLGALPKGLNRRPPPGVGAAVGAAEDRRAASLDLLRARLQFTQRGDGGGGGSTILVTSPGSNSGKAAVTANLAASLARAGERVVCVDANLRRPSLHRYLGLPEQAPGLVDVLESSVDLEDALIRIELAPPSENGAKPTGEKGRLDVLRAGSPPSRADLLTPEAVEGLLERLRDRADYVVFDSPTLLMSDFFPLAVKSDNVLLVARRGRTTKAQAEAARETLARIGVDSVGVVLTDVRPGDGYA